MISRHFRNKDNEYISFEVTTTTVDQVINCRVYPNYSVMKSPADLRVDWGDGSPMSTVDGGTSPTHSYGATGTYPLKVWTREKYKNINRFIFNTFPLSENLDLSQWEWLYYIWLPGATWNGTFSMPNQYNGVFGLQLLAVGSNGTIDDANGILDLTPWSSISNVFIFGGNLTPTIKRVKINQNSSIMSSGFKLYSSSLVSLGPSASELGNRTLDFTGLNMASSLVIDNVLLPDPYNEVILPSSAFHTNGINELRITGGSFSSIDLSNIKWSTSTTKDFFLSNNKILTTIINPTSSISGRFDYLSYSGCSSISEIDLSVYELGTAFQLYLSNGDCPNLTTVTFSSSTYSTANTIYCYGAALSNAPNFSDIPNVTENNNASVRLDNNSLDAANVNKILVDLDTNSTGSFTGRTINLSQNAAPDGTSGGFDGTTAKANLISKGFTVTTA